MSLKKKKKKKSVGSLITRQTVKGAVLPGEMVIKAFTIPAGSSQSTMEKSHSTCSLSSK